MLFYPFFFIMKKSLYWLPFVLYSIVMVKLLLTPADRIPPLLMSQGDKILHLLAFAGLIFFYAAGITSFFTNSQIRPVHWIVSFVCLSAAGGLIEFLQMMVPGRNGSLEDFYFNNIGLAIGLIFSLVFMFVIGIVRSLSIFKK